MIGDLAARRLVWAQELRALCSLKTERLVQALAEVPREAYLPPGPWELRGEGEFGRSSLQTPDADPSHVYQNVSIAIDGTRQLFNGAPSTVVPLIDKLGLAPGARVLHVGCGLGYYSAVMAHSVGPSGRVVAIEVDPRLALDAARNLAPIAWVDARQGDGTALGGEYFDRILVHAGTTHPHEAWLDRLAPAGRLLLPITYTHPMMGAIGKGPMVAVSKAGDEFEAQVAAPMLAIYSAVGLRDPQINEELGKALRRDPSPSLKRLRRDRHAVEATCWLHHDGVCLSTR